MVEGMIKAQGGGGVELVMILNGVVLTRTKSAFLFGRKEPGVVTGRNTTRRWALELGICTKTMSTAIENSHESLDQVSLHI
jgi:hypothetical protein